jgi:CheY-like chemotaxis protein
LTSGAFNSYNSVGTVATNKGNHIFMAQVGLLEDNARIAKLCSTLLHYAGHQVTVYADSQACLCALLPDLSLDLRTHNGKIPVLESISSPPLPVEVLILDLALPDIHGIEVLRYLTSHPQTQALPLILCTAATTSEVAKALRVAPHANIVEKPFKLQTLVGAISTALGNPSK